MGVIVHLVNGKLVNGKLVNGKLVNGKLDIAGSLN
jgi:hypothetical protein